MIENNYNKENLILEDNFLKNYPILNVDQTMQDNMIMYTWLELSTEQPEDGTGILNLLPKQLKVEDFRKIKMTAAFPRDQFDNIELQAAQRINEEHKYHQSRFVEFLSMMMYDRVRSSIIQLTEIYSKWQNRGYKWFGYNPSDLYVDYNGGSIHLCSKRINARAMGLTNFLKSKDRQNLKPIVICHSLEIANEITKILGPTKDYQNSNGPVRMIGSFNTCEVYLITDRPIVDENLVIVTLVNNDPYKYAPPTFVVGLDIEKADTGICSFSFLEVNKPLTASFRVFKGKKPFIRRLLNL